MTQGMPRQKVEKVFDDVAPYYDSMNDLLSLGAHHCWKRWFCAQPASVDGVWADLATGSGDILMGLIHRGIARKYCGIDPCPQMLATAKHRFAAQGFFHPRSRRTHPIDFIQKPAEDLQDIDNQSISGMSCVFGLRNMSDRPAALAEMARILKPGAECHIMEFAPPTNSLPMRLYKKYLDYALPLIGQIAFGDPSSYRYLAESIQDFWTVSQCQKALEEAGFLMAADSPVWGGIVHYYKGVRQ